MTSKTATATAKGVDNFVTVTTNVPVELLLDRGRNDSAIDPCVAQLVERSVRRCIRSIQEDGIHPRAALKNVASFLVAELSVDQFKALWQCYSAYPDSPVLRLLLDTLSEAVEHTHPEQRFLARCGGAAPAWPSSLQRLDQQYPQPAEPQQPQPAAQHQQPQQEGSKRQARKRQHFAGSDQECGNPPALAPAAPLLPTKRQRSGSSDQQSRLPNRVACKAASVQWLAECAAAATYQLDRAPAARSLSSPRGLQDHAQRDQHP